MDTQHLHNLGDVHVHAPEGMEIEDHLARQLQTQERQRCLRRDVDRLAHHVDVLQWCGIVLSLALIVQTITLVVVGT